jgi:ribosome-binding factor A
MLESGHVAADAPDAVVSAVAPSDLACFDFAMSIRTARVAEEIQKILGERLIRGLRDPLPGFVTIRGVEVTSDFTAAKVFVSVFGSDEQKQGAIAGLQQQRGALRHELGQKIRLRHTPTLNFFLDESSERAARVHALLDEAKAQQARLASSPPPPASTPSVTRPSSPPAAPAPTPAAAPAPAPTPAPTAVLQPVTMPTTTAETASTKPAATTAATKPAATKKGPTKKATTKKPATKKPATTKAATKKPATKKTTTKKPATKKPATKKAVTKKPATKKSPTKKPTTKKAATKKKG